MSRWDRLARFLTTDPHDVGCAEAMDALDVYVDLVVSDPHAAQRYPGVAAHLAACGPCDEDFEGLLVAGLTVWPGRRFSSPARSPQR